jgi:predicted RNA methylase
MSDGKRYWSITEGAFNCLIDEKRTKTFRQAIMDSVSQGNVAVDAGCGTGILALFAAEAGAKRVYAIESDPHYLPGLKQSLRLNQFGDRIKLINADATTAVLPESVDVIICEMIATGLIEELQVPAMNNLLKYGKKKVKVVLAAFENYVDLVENNDLFYNHRLKIIRYEYPGEATLKSRPLTETVKYAQVNFSRPVRNSAINCQMILTTNGGG